MKKILALVVCLAILSTMVLPCTVAFADDSWSVWDGNPVGAYSWFNNELKEIVTTGNKVVHITSASQLAMLACGAGRTAAYSGYTKDQLCFEGVTFILDTNIDLNNKPWSPICSFSSDQPFKGTFDGNGHTIKNMYSPSTGSENMYASNRNPNGKNVFGLFGYLAGTVKNLKIKDAKWEYDSVNVFSVNAGGAIAGVLGSYGNNVYVNGKLDDYIAQIDNCSAENVELKVKRTGSAFGTHGFSGLAGLIYNGNITNSYVKNVTINALDTDYVPSKVAGLGYVNGLKYSDGYVRGLFEISNNFVLGAEMETKGDTDETTVTTELPLMYNDKANYYVPSNNYSDVVEDKANDHRTYVANEEALRQAIVTADSAFYSEGENQPVILRGETTVTNFSLEYDDEEYEFLAKANVAKIPNNSMLMIAFYENDDDTTSSPRLVDVNIKYYNRTNEFNSSISVDYDLEYDSEIHTVKAFVINAENVFPYVNAIEYEE